MPKPIPLTIEVEEGALGFVWRRLKTLPGVVSIRFIEDEDHEPKRSYGYLNSEVARPRLSHKPARRGRKSIGRLSLLEQIADGKVHNKKDLRDAWAATTGLNMKQFTNYEYNSRKSGLAKSPKPGTIQITAEGQQRLAETQE